LEEGNLNSTARDFQLDLWKTAFCFSNVGFYLILKHKYGKANKISLGL